MEKDFDCIAFKRQSQAKIYEEIKNLTPQKEIDYFRNKVEKGPFAEWWKTLKNRTYEPI